MGALAPSRLNQVFLYKPGTIATEEEARRFEKYRDLRDNVYNFKLMAMEVQCSLGESIEFFIRRLYKTLCCSHDDQRTVVF